MSKILNLEENNSCTLTIWCFLFYYVKCAENQNWIWIKSTNFVTFKFKVCQIFVQSVIDWLSVMIYDSVWKLPSLLQAFNFANLELLLLL